MTIRVIKGITYKELEYKGEKLLISQFGDIINEKTSHKRKINYNNGKCKYPILNYKGTSVPVHKLVALAWCDYPQGAKYEDLINTMTNRKYVVDHIDGNKNNYNADNLRWCTPYENVHFNNFKSGYIGAPKGNQNAKGRKACKSVNRYIYHYNGRDYNLTELSTALNCTKSKITESFRRNLGLVRSGLLTRSIKEKI